MTKLSLEIKWLRIVTILVMAYYLMATFLISFDPGYQLEEIIMDELYNDFMPFEAIPVYDFFFPLYAWSNVVIFALLFGLIQFGLPQKQKWAYDFLLIGLGLWLAGGIVMASLQQVFSLLFVMASILLFIPPLITLRKQFYGKKK